MSPDVKASQDVDFALAEHENSRVTWDGSGFELASRNELANPDLRDFDPAEDAPVNLSLGYPAAAIGWGYAARHVSNPESRMTRQNTAMFPISQSFETQAGPLIDGPEVNLDSGATIARPFPPTIRLRQNARVGFRAGYYGVALAYIIGPANAVATTTRMTDAGPREIVHLEQGDGLDVGLPDSVPEGVTGLAVLTTDAQSNEDAARRGALFTQVRTRTHEGIRGAKRAWGPFTRGYQPVENQTYIGGLGQHPPPEFRVVKEPGVRPRFTRCRVSYSFMTTRGISASQQVTQMFSFRENLIGCRLGWRPRYFPPGVIAWRGEILTDDQRWFAAPFTDPGKWCHANSNDGGALSSHRNWQEMDRNRFNPEDDSGLPGPDSAPTSLTPIPTENTIPTGTYEVHGLLYDQSGRIALPSEPVRVNVPAGFTFDVHRPPGSNLIPNPDREDRDNDEGDPDGWEITPPDGGSVEEDEKEVVIRNPGTPGKVINIKLPNIPIRFPKISIRLPVDIKRLVSGKVNAALRTVNTATGAVRQTTVATFANQTASIVNTGVVRQVQSFSAGADTEADAQADAGSLATVDADGFVELLEGEDEVSVVLESDGTDGPADLDYAIGVPSSAPGDVSPPLYAWERSHVYPGRDQDEILPQGGGCVVVEEPQDVPDELREENLLRYSEDLSEWEAQDASVEVDAAPSPPLVLSGEDRADIVTLSEGGSVSRIDPPTLSEDAVVGTIYLRSDNPATVRLRLVAGASEASGDVFVGEDWRRYQVSVPNATGDSVTLALVGLEEEETTLEVWGGQVNRGEEAHSYIWTTEQAERLCKINAVDYYGPVGTPPHDRYFARGYRTPVTPGETMVFSAYVGWRGVTQRTDYLRAIIRNRRGEMVAALPALVRGVSGTRQSERYHYSFDVPAGDRDEAGATFEIVSGGGSDGYARAMAFQLEPGTEPSPYTNKNALAGYRRFTFDTQVSGVAPGSALRALGVVARWIEAATIDTTPPGTETRTWYRTSPDGSPNSWSQWVEDWQAAPKQRVWQVEVDMTTTDPTASPLVDWVGVSFARPSTVLLRADGTEYPGGVLVVDFPDPDPGRLTDYELSDANTSHRGVRGDVLWTADGFDLQTFLRDNGKRIRLDQQTGDGTHVVEMFAINRRYRIHITDAFRFATDRKRTVREPGTAGGRWYIYEAGGLAAEVIAEEQLWDDPEDELLFEVGNRV